MFMNMRTRSKELTRRGISCPYFEPNLYFLFLFILSSTLICRKFHKIFLKITVDWFIIIDYKNFLIIIISVVHNSYP